MQEGNASEIELQEMKGETLQLLVAFMYGKVKPRKLTQAQLVSLFLAADKHQVLGLARCYSRHVTCKSVHAYMLEFWKHAVCYKLAPKCTSIMIGRDPGGACFFATCDITACDLLCQPAAVFGQKQLIETRHCS